MFLWKPLILHGFPMVFPPFLVCLPVAMRMLRGARDGAAHTAFDDTDAPGRP